MIKAVSGALLALAGGRGLQTESRAKCTMQAAWEITLCRAPLRPVPLRVLSRAQRMESLVRHRDQEGRVWEKQEWSQEEEDPCFL